MVYDEETYALAPWSGFRYQGSLGNPSERWPTCEEAEAKEWIAGLGELRKESAEHEEERYHDREPG